MINEFHEDRRQCTDLINAFAYYVDHRLFSDAVSLFSEGGSFIRPDGVKKGHTEIASLWEGRPETVVTRHLVGAPFFLSATGTEAESVTQCTIYQAEGDGKAPPAVKGPIGVAEFHDHFVKTPGGWKFSRREVTPAIIQSP
ncbi:nuclear transport factor 2 family protein [Halioglobus maricola]|uniref:Nuclear transport factor 2 family protein n=1 Tax=Halioglobus maricola TaxID=2601894 RepID=A0A5P9NPJ9_9GAMM|nr:nuclear transport factor 2 family protein [Halioglobus maricola]QFU77204.1 nuclear transport factor 2 family protein [Halioglobus maricola]